MFARPDCLPVTANVQTPAPVQTGSDLDVAATQDCAPLALGKILSPASQTVEWLQPSYFSCSPAVLSSVREELRILINDEV
jgi:hypothetical protein